MTCKDCLYADACEGYIPTDLDRDVWHYCREGRTDQIPDIEERCSSFKDSTNYVEVVRCKDCKYYMLWEDSEDKRTCSKSIGLMISDPDDFCSYGERREGE